MDIEVVGGCIAIVKQLDGGQDNVFPPSPPSLPQFMEWVVCILGLIRDLGAFS